MFFKRSTDFYSFLATTTTTTTAPSEGVVLGEGPSEGSGLVGLAETGPLPPGFNEAGSGFIGGGGDSGLSFGADVILIAFC